MRNIYDSRAYNRVASAYERAWLGLIRIVRRGYDAMETGLRFPLSSIRRWAAARQNRRERLVLHALVTSPRRENNQAELCEMIGMATGTIYPTLARLEQAGYVASDWEYVTPPGKRRIYRITATGVARLGYGYRREER